MVVHEPNVALDPSVNGLISKNGFNHFNSLLKKDKKKEKLKEKEK